MRSDNKIVFQLALVSIIDKVNSRINLLVFYLGKHGNSHVPMLWLVANKITGSAGLIGNRLESGSRVCATEAHSHYRLGDLRDPPLVMAPGRSFRRGIADRAQRKDRLSGSQEQRVTRTSRKELDLAVGLAGIRLELHRQGKDLRKEGWAGRAITGTGRVVAAGKGH